MARSMLTQGLLEQLVRARMEPRNETQAQAQAYDMYGIMNAMRGYQQEMPPDVALSMAAPSQAEGYMAPSFLHEEFAAAAQPQDELMRRLGLAKLQRMNY